MNAHEGTIGVGHVADIAGAMLSSARRKDLLAPLLSERAWHMLDYMPRFAERLELLIESRLGPVDPASLSEFDRAIVAAGAEFWERIGRAAGGIANRFAIRRLVLGTDISVLIEACGEDARDAVLTFDDVRLSAPTVALEERTIDTLIESVTVVAAIAYRGWLATLPNGFAARLALLRPADRSARPLLSDAAGADLFCVAARSVLDFRNAT